MKSSKNKPKQANIKKTRKQVRKEKRQQKKVRKHEYYTNRVKPGKFVLKPPSDDSEPEQEDVVVKKQPNKNQENKASKVLQVDQQTKDLDKEKREQQKLVTQMQKQRKKQMLQANIEEDRNIKMLEKQLKLNKRKTKSIPKSFAFDGLDYLLELCDKDNMESIVAAEQQLNDGDEEFEEDFALMTGKDREDESVLNENDSEDKMLKGIKRKKNTNNEKQMKKVKSTELLKDGDESETYSEEDFDENFNNSNEEESNEDQSEEESNEDQSEEESNEDSEDINEDKTKNSKSKTVIITKRKKGKIKNEAQMFSSDDEFSDNNQSDSDLHLEAEFSDESSKHSNKEDNNTADNNDNKDIIKDSTWEDIYGRLRDKDGNIVNESKEKYIPPAVRAKLEAGQTEDKKKIEKMNRLKRQLKGLLNRLAESNMYSISNQIEDLYMQNSRHEMNDALTSLILEAVASNQNTPERMLLEHIVLVTVLHSNVGTEVGAHFLQTVVKTFDELTRDIQPIENKYLDNIVNIISQLYNFKVFHSQLLYQILKRLYEDFTEKNVECILLVLKNVGFTMRKDDPLALKELILNLQRMAASTSEEVKDNPRVKFMLEILLAIKNNNMNKIPNYDTSYSEHLKKIMKTFIRKGNYVTQLNISLDDLLKAEERGKWWVVGSAWTGNIGDKEEKPAIGEKIIGYSQNLLDLARKQRMNTDARRNIFCIIMSAEDYLDAFEKLLHLNLKNQQEREIIHVLLHCCLQEKLYNPYYSVLAQKFCDHDRKYQMIVKYSVWDKLKALTDCSGPQISNLAKLLAHLFLEKGLPISILKVVQFGDLDKVTLRFVRQILLGVLLCDDIEQCQEVFDRVARTDKLKLFRERLRLFIHHFLLRNVKDEKQKSVLEERTKIVEKILTLSDKKMKF